MPPLDDSEKQALAYRDKVIAKYEKHRVHQAAKEARQARQQTFGKRKSSP